MSDNNLDCSKCDKAHKRMRGCKEDCNQPLQFGTELYYRCPLAIINAIDNRIIELYRLFKLGYLPFQGGLGDQPAALIDIFLLIDSEIKQLEYETHKRENK